MSYYSVCRDLLVEYLPPSLRPFAMAQTATPNLSRFDALVPAMYRKRILATALACRIIYNEGVHFLDNTLGSDIQRGGGPASGDHPMTLSSADANTRIAEWSFRCRNVIY
jgi:hypothetical protein